MNLRWQRDSGHFGGETWTERGNEWMGLLRVLVICPLSLAMITGCIHLELMHFYVCILPWDTWWWVAQIALQGRTCCPAAGRVVIGQPPAVPQSLQRAALPEVTPSRGSLHLVTEQSRGIKMQPFRLDVGQVWWDVSLQSELLIGWDSVEPAARVNFPSAQSCTHSLPFTGVNL